METQRQTYIVSHWLDSNTTRGLTWTALSPSTSRLLSIIYSTWTLSRTWLEVSSKSESGVSPTTTSCLTRCRKHEVKSSEQQLQELEARLRQADEQLQRLQSRHRRMQSESVLAFRPRERNTYNSSDSEGHSSNTSDTDRR